MNLVKLKVKNFRCYKNETELLLNELTTLIGKNDIGKSAILDALDMALPIPQFLREQYLSSSLLFIGCSLYNDRTMEVLKAVREEAGDKDLPQHFTILQALIEVSEMVKRNAFLENHGITAIWYEPNNHYMVEEQLRLMRIELGYLNLQT